MFPKLYHYRKSSEPFQLYHCLQRDGSSSFKPHGLWITPDSEDNWEWWCQAEEFNLENLSNRFEVTLQDHANILWIKGPEQLDKFAETYKRSDLSDVWELYLIDWHKVAADYQGILIIPYIWERRFNNPWYYSWDCASGCIWDPNAIEKILLDPKYVKRNLPVYLNT